MAITSPSAVAVFCGKSKEHILRDGGTQSWHLVPRNAKLNQYVVCCRSAVSWVEGTEDRGSAFLIGRVGDVVPATDEDSGKRYLIRMTEYAEIDVPKAWKGWRNPVKYTTLTELGIDLEGVQFKPMPSPTLASKDSQSQTDSLMVRSTLSLITPLTIAQAKRALAATYEVSEDAVEITIRG